MNIKFSLLKIFKANKLTKNFHVTPLITLYSQRRTFANREKKIKSSEGKENYIISIENMFKNYNEWRNVEKQEFSLKLYYVK
jgi:hypothetical protein